MDALHHHLYPLSSYISQKLSLPHFQGTSFTVFVVSFVGFTLLHPLSAHLLSPALFGTSYSSLNKRNKFSWNTHVVSMVHACIVGPWALYLCSLPMEKVDNDRAFGWDDRLGPFHAVAVAYFLWDTFETIYSGADIAFVIHGMSCLMIYTFAYRPFVAYYGPRALLWELSTPFLNIHWFLDKANKTGSTFQLLNGLTLLVMFFCARILYGTIISLRFFQTMYSVRDQVPYIVIFLFGSGNLSLNLLNFIWFSKMIAALRKRFPPKPLQKAADASSISVEPLLTSNGSSSELKLGKPLQNGVVRSKGE